MATGAALVITFKTPDRMALIAVLYLVALAAPIVAGRFARSWAWGTRSNGFKMLTLLAVLAVLTSVSVWTVLDTWSTIGKCERREESLFLTNTSRVWYEGTACTQDQREGHFEEN